MSYRLRYTVNIDWVGDGSGAMEVAGAQTIGFSATVPVPYTPGGDTPTLANFYTAMTNVSTAPAAACMALDIGTQINNNLPRIQGFATGGG